MTLPARHKRSDELYASRARPGLPPLAHPVCGSIGERVAEEVEAELARGGGRGGGREGEGDVEDRALLGDDCSRYRQRLSDKRASPSGRKLEEVERTFDLRAGRDELERAVRLLEDESSQADERGVLGALDCGRHWLGQYEKGMHSPSRVRRTTHR